ncbi:NUDIX hydrolase [Paramicrobacterium agarici]|uniref:8-oxo-dGTP diphosphatase n=1 Tax=Paramicrobacterium agarici TaxID=630514 RepID=A0A2A9DXP8_9MICO|nr:NUDIX hydrolase [Microbacterium agarici]PFG30772.1 8-oxo-dGTP diphosphatase [Microbacterium agarici]
MSRHEKAVFAAGALCWREIAGEVRVLVIHRTKQGDVTLPKGKVDPGESLPQTAVREVKEETGFDVTLGVPVGISHYTLGSGRDKFVHYWAAEVTERAVQKSTFVPNGEVAAQEWVSLDRAQRYLTYPQDVDVVARFADLVDEGVTATFALIVLRHAKATARGDWDGSDASRPLTPKGVRQAASAVPSILALNPKKIVTSSAVRCVTTVAPLAAASGIEPKHTDALSQDAWEEGTSDVRSVIGKRIRKRKTAVVCSHGPVIPDILREIALATGTLDGSYLRDAAALGTGEFSIVHLSATNPGSGIITIETHPTRD